MAMRMGPFSQPGVIQYINQHFVPIFISNEDYRAGKPGNKEKKVTRPDSQDHARKGAS